MEQLVDQWVELDKQIKDLTRQQQAVEAALGGHPVGTELQGHNSRVLVCDRSVLDPTALEKVLKPAIWRRITKRVPVAVLLKAEVKRGNIEQSVVDKCTGRSKTWFKAIM